MANEFQTLINDISTVVTPQLTFDRCIISKQKYDGVNQIDFLLDAPGETTKNQLNFKFKFTLNDRINLIEKNGYWWNNKVISKFLKFKTIFCVSKEEEDILLLDPRQVKGFDKNRVHTFTFENFKSRSGLNTKKITDGNFPKINTDEGLSSIQQRDLVQPLQSAQAQLTVQNQEVNQLQSIKNKNEIIGNFFIDFENSLLKDYIGFYTRPKTKEEIANSANDNSNIVLTPTIEYISVVHFVYYDTDEISKAFNINFSNTYDIEKYFYGKPEAVKIVENGTISSNRVLDLSIIENTPEVSSPAAKDYLRNLEEKQKNESKQKNPYFSDMFASYDVFLPSDIQQKTKGEPLNYIKYGFFFDIKNFLKDNMIFGKLVDLLPPERLKNLISLSKANYCKLTRINEKADIYGDFQEKIVSTTLKENFDFKLESKRDEIGVSILNDMLFFSGKDHNITKNTYGKFNYKFEIQLIDPSYIFILLLKSILLGNLNNIRYYLQVASLPEIPGDVLLDQNPYIDQTRENSVGSFKRGYFITDENRFSEDLREIFNPTAVIKIADLYSLMQKIVDGLNNYNLNEIYYDNIRQGIINAMLPGISNPEAVTHVLNMHEKLLVQFDSLLQTKNKPKISIKDSPIPANRQLPLNNQLAGNLIGGFLSVDAYANYLQTLKVEHVFTSAKNRIQAQAINKFNEEKLNPVADSELPDSFGFEFIEDKNKDLVGFSVVDGLVSFDVFLKDIVTPGKDKIIKTTLEELEQRLNAVSNIPLNNSTVNLLEYMKSIIFSNIDFIFSLYGTPYFDAYLNKIFAVPSTLTANDVVNRILSLYDVFNENNVSLEFPDDLRKKFDAISADSSQARLVQNAERLFNILQIFSCYNIAIGLLNNSKLINGKTIFQNKIEYYSSPENSTAIKIDSTSSFYDKKLIKSSEFKIKNETLKEIYRIGFTKNADGYYNLKNPEYMKVNPEDAAGYYLCSLEPYVKAEAFLDTPVYENIPVYNKFFILDKGIIQFDILTPAIVTPIILNQLPTNLPVVAPSLVKSYDVTWFYDKPGYVYTERVIENYFFDEYTLEGSNISGDLQTSRGDTLGYIFAEKTNYFISLTVDSEFFGEDILEFKLYYNDRQANKWRTVCFIKFENDQLSVRDNIAGDEQEAIAISNTLKDKILQDILNDQNITNYFSDRKFSSDILADYFVKNYGLTNDAQFGDNIKECYVAQNATRIENGKVVDNTKDLFLNVFKIIYKNLFQEHIERIETTGKI